MPDAYNFTGYRAEDVLRYRNGVNIIDMKYPFFLIEHVTDLINPQRMFPHDGILGLSPDVDGDDYLTLGVPMPVHMKRKKRINRAIVALDMKKGDGQTSTFELGKISTDKFRYKNEQESDLGWISVKTNTTRFSWRSEMKNIFYNRTSFNDTKFEDKSIDDGFQNMAVFDSFYGGIHLPQTEWKPLMSMEKAALKAKGIDLICNQKSFSCYYEGQCQPDKFSSFGFNFVGDRAYILQPKDYLIQNGNTNGLDICQIAIYGNKINATEYILGDVFMQNFYVIMDYENSRFAINGVYTPVKEIGTKGYRDPEIYD